MGHSRKFKGFLRPLKDHGCVSNQERCLAIHTASKKTSHSDSSVKVDWSDATLEAKHVDDNGILRA